MSKLIKQFITEESESIKFRYSNGSAEDVSAPAVRIYSYGGGLNMELIKMPNEVRLQLSDEPKDRSDFRFDVVNAITPLLKKLEAIDPEQAGVMKSELFEKLVAMAEDGNGLKKKVEDEYERIFAHLKEMLRATIIEYHHDNQEFLDNAAQQLKDEYTRKLEDLLK